MTRLGRLFALLASLAAWLVFRPGDEDVEYHEYDYADGQSQNLVFGDPV